MKQQFTSMPEQSESKRPRLRILGIRGVPAQHGGFETFAEHLATYLVGRGWHVTVYCQETGTGPTFEDNWHGIHRVRIPVGEDTAVNSIKFDWKAIRHAAKTQDLCLTLGYNTAVFCAWLRMNGVPNVINMDGIEYTRAKWGRKAKLWFRLNEWAGCWLGNHLIADHPEIKKHLLRKAPDKKITMIPYGGAKLSNVPDAPAKRLGLEPGRYLTVIARPEPENSILEIVQGFSAKHRNMKLAVLGTFSEHIAYHRSVKAAASAEVVFLGAIYDTNIVRALRYHSAAYIHGHQVGGTNPSLVEALGAGNAVIAHQNRFNHWVVGAKGKFFTDAATLDACISQLFAEPEELLQMKDASTKQFTENFLWDGILQAYENVLVKYQIATEDKSATTSNLVT